MSHRFSNTARLRSKIALEGEASSIVRTIRQLVREELGIPERRSVRRNGGTVGMIEDITHETLRQRNGALYE